ncbi:hypothetical protein SMMN14_07360 [Sphaerulina musiva]
MTSHLAAARAAHLQASSEALMTTSPSISAYLQIQQFHDGKPTIRTRTTQPCSSCGTFLFPGYNSSITNANAKKRTRQDRLAGKSSAAKILKCSTCETTHQILPAAATAAKTTTTTKSTGIKKRGITSGGGHSATASSLSTIAAETGIAKPSESEYNSPSGLSASSIISTTTASKSRNRKNKKSSLQALLSSNRSNITTGTSISTSTSTTSKKGVGLGLGDFMK